MKVLSLLVSEVICDEVGALQKSEEQDVGTIMHDKRMSEGKRDEQQVAKKCIKDVKLLNLSHESINYKNVQDQKTFRILFCLHVTYAAVRVAKCNE